MDACGCCQLCQSDEVWERLYCVHNDSRAITEDLRAHAKRVGWQSVFFANKLQLQVRLTLQHAYNKLINFCSQANNRSIDRIETGISSMATTRS